MKLAQSGLLVGFFAIVIGVGCPPADPFNPNIPEGDTEAFPLPPIQAGRPTFGDVTISAARSVVVSGNPTRDLTRLGAAASANVDNPEELRWRIRDNEDGLDTGSLLDVAAFNAGQNRVVVTSEFWVGAEAIYQAPPLATVAEPRNIVIEVVEPESTVPVDTDADSDSSADATARLQTAEALVLATFTIRVEPRDAGALRVTTLAPAPATVSVLPNNAAAGTVVDEDTVVLSARITGGERFETDDDTEAYEVFWFRGDFVLQGDDGDEIDIDDDNVPETLEQDSDDPALFISTRQWKVPQGAVDLVGAQTFTVQATDRVGSVITGIVTVNVVLAPQVQASIDNSNLVQNGLNRALAATVTGGAAPFDYAWTVTPDQGAAFLSDASSSTPTFTPPLGVSSLTFTVVVTDAQQNRATDQVSATAPAPPTSGGGGPPPPPPPPGTGLTVQQPRATPSNPNVVATDTRTLVTTITGGVPPYSFVWTSDRADPCDATYAPFDNPTGSTNTDTVSVIWTAPSPCEHNPPPPNQPVPYQASLTLKITDSDNPPDEELRFVTFTVDSVPTLVLSDIPDGTEGDVFTGVTVSRTGPTVSDLIVDLTEDSNSMDLLLNGASGTTMITIPSGSKTSAPFDVTLVDDGVFDGGAETVNVTAEAVDPITLVMLVSASDTVEITDAQAPDLIVEFDDGTGTFAAIGPTMITEDEGVTRLARVRRSNGITGLQTIVTLSTNDLVGDLAPDISVNNGNTLVAISPSSDSVTFDVALLADGVVSEGPETVVITASAPGFNDGMGDVVINDLDVPRLELTIPDGTEGTVVMGTVTRVTGSTVGSLDVTLAAVENDGNAVADVTFPSLVTILDGNASATFPITLVQDTTVEGSEVVDFTADGIDPITLNPLGQGTDTLTITDDDSPTLTVVVPDGTEGDLAIQGTVSHDGLTTNAVDVQLSVIVNSNDLVVDTSVTILAGENSANFNVEYVDDAMVEGTEIATVQASSPGFNTGTDDVTITDNDMAELTLDIPDGAEGDMVIATVSRTGPTTSALTVNLETIANPNDLVLPPGDSVDIPIGMPSFDFVITLVDDNLAEGTETATVRATVPDDMDPMTPDFDPVTANVVITDNDPKVDLSIMGSTNLPEIGAMMMPGTKDVTVVMTGTAAPGDDVTVTLTLSGTATLGVDYNVSGTGVVVNVPAGEITVLIPDGDTDNNVLFTAVDDGAGNDGGESIIIEITNVVKAFPGTALLESLTITD